MTRIDFYVMSDRARGDRFSFACRLTEKIYQQGRRVLLYAASSTEMSHLDRLLWTFRQGSFVPHGIETEVDPSITPVLIGYADQTGEEQDVLVNLSPTVPEIFSRFDRMAEVIDQDPENRSAGRERFRFYRDQGYPLETHDISK